MEQTRAEPSRPPIHRTPYVYGLIACSAAALAALTAAGPGRFSWWLVALIAFSVAALLVPAPEWVGRWAPMILVGVLFLALGGLSALQVTHADSVSAIDVDRALTGAVVPVWLQQHLPALLGAPAAVLTGEYMLHYVAPLLTAWWLWRRRPEHFDRFVAAYMTAMVLGFALYIVLPQTPPWFAAQHGMLPPLHRTIVDVLQSLNAGTLYAGADPEPLGAMPSLHVTIPVLVAITAICRLRSPWRWLWILYPVTVAFGVLLMAEHYLLDTFAGAAVAVVAVILVRMLPSRAVSGPLLPRVSAKQAGAEPAWRS